jgi:Protein of unknown function (DUF3276)
MGKFDNKRPFQEGVFSKKVNGGRKRTYFIDVKKTRTDDLYLILSENSNKPDGTFEKHRIFLYKEDLNRFLSALTEAADKVKELLPDYDFDQFDGRFDTLDTGYKKDSFGKDDDVAW